MANIGHVLAEKLVEVGIESPAQLKEMGSEKAFSLIVEKDKDAWYNMIFAIEGAIQGIRWHYLAPETKERLKKFVYAKKYK